MFKITWDRDNNGVTLTMRSTDETLNVSPRLNIDLLCKNNETTMFLLEYEALEFINTQYRRYRLNASQQVVNETVDFQ